MPRFPVSPEKEQLLIRRMDQLGIRETDLEEQFVKGSGPGGQKINKTSSCVKLRHLPSGIEIRCQAARSQALNRFLARRELCDRLAARIQGETSKRRSEAEKIRRQKRRRSRRAKEKMLKAKRVRSELKATRRKPDRG